MVPLIGPDARGCMCVAMFLALAMSTGTAPLAWSYKTGNYSWTVAVSPDGRHVIAGSDDMRTYFFDTKSADGKPLWSFQARGYVREVVISEGATCAAASDTDGGVFFFRPLDSLGNPVWSFRSDSPIEALTMSENGNYLAAGDRRGNVYLFKTDNVTNPLVWQNVIPGGVLALALSKSGALVGTATQGGLYFFSNISLSNHVWSFQEYTSFPYVAMGEDADHIVVGGSDGYVYSVNGLGQLMDKQRVGGAVSALSFSDTAGLIVVGSTSGNLSLYSIGQELVRMDSVDTGRPVTSMALSRNGERIAIGNLDGEISMFDGSLANLRWSFSIGAIVHSISISSNGQIAAAVGDTGSIYLFDEQTPPANQTIQGPTLLRVAVVIVAIAAFTLGYFAWRRTRGIKVLLTCRRMADMVNCLASTLRIAVHLRVPPPSLHL